MMSKPRKRISLKSLSPARQALIVRMHEEQFGTIRNLPVAAGEPVLPEAKITRKRSLKKQVVAKPVSRNFYLKAPHVELLSVLDRIGTGTLDVVTFRDGLPCEYEQGAVA
ncbi:MAG: hypothetical protein ACO1RT_02830 [Planctomycetaceae bacterium]